MEKERKDKFIKSCEASIVELYKIAEQTIDLSELDPEKSRVAAQAKKVALQDIMDIYKMIDELQKKDEKEEEKPEVKVEVKEQTESKGLTAEARAKNR